MALSDSIRLLFEAKGDTSDAKSAFASLRTVVTNEVGAIESKGASAFTNLAKNIGLTEASAASLAGALPIIGIALVGVGVVALGVTEKLFHLAESAADFGSKIHDMAEKTGLSTEAISSLKVAAEQSGSSIEQVSHGLTRFTLLMGEAANGSEKAKEKLARLGVTSTDLNKGLEQVLKTIYELPPGIQQNIAATDAFGKKLGGELIPFVNQFHGDLPGLIAECEKLGFTIGQKDADAADKFGDQMDTLKGQLSAVGRTIGFELLPVFNDLATQVSEWLVKNKGEVKSWAETIKNAVEATIVAMDRFKNLYDDVKNSGQFLSGGAGAAYTGFDNEAYKREAERIAVRKAALDIQMNNIGKPSGGGLNDGGENPNNVALVGPTPKQNADALAEAQKAAEERAAEREKYRERELAALKGHIKESLTVEHEGFVAALAELEKSFIAKTISEDDFNKEANRRSSQYARASAKLIRDQLKLDAQGATPGENSNLNEQADRDAKAVSDEIEAARQGRVKTILESKKKEIAVTAELTKKAYDNDLSVFDSLQERKLASALRIAEEIGISEADQARRSEQIAVETLQHKIDKLKIYRDTFKADSVEYNDIAIEVDNLERSLEVMRDTNATNEHKRQNIAIADAKEIARIAKEQWDEQRKHDAELHKVNSRTPLVNRVDAENDRKNANPFQYLIDGYKKFVDTVKLSAPTLKETMQSLGGLFVRAFDGIANAIGGVVQQWVLYGTTGPAVLRKVLAAALASLAAEAAVRALWELALGFASLFFNPPEAAAHFTAAAIFGGIAGVSAIAGRAVAGNAFQKESSGSAGASNPSNSGQGTNRNGGNVYSSNPDQTVEAGRNAPGGLRTEVVLTFRDKSDWFSQMFKVEMQKNGVVRRLVQDAV